MSGLPVYCARGRTGHHAAWLVRAPGKQEVVCDGHLPESRKWAGSAARVEPVAQPAGVTPPQQTALF